MQQLRLLDICCGAGGCSVGYHRAAVKLGIDLQITGVDINDQPNYPFYFERSDALEFLTREWKYFTHIHASPPCKAYSVANRNKKTNHYQDVYTDLSKKMYDTELPGVIENVYGSPVRGDIVLNGQMFKLNVHRYRKFELVNWWMMQPGTAIVEKRTVRNGKIITVAGHGYGGKSKYGDPCLIDGKNEKEKRLTAMGIDWMNMREVTQAVPPAYTEYIGLSFLKSK